MVGRQLPFFSLIVPFWLIWAFAGFRGMMRDLAGDPGRGVVVRDPAVPDLELHGPWLVDIVAALISMVCLALFLKVWQPQRDLDLAGAAHGATKRSHARRRRRADGHSRARIVPAWTPWIILSVVRLRLGHCRRSRRWLNGRLCAEHPDRRACTTWSQKVPPVVAKPTTEGAVYVLQLAVRHRHRHPDRRDHLRPRACGYSPRRIVQAYARTLWLVRYSLLTIAAMLALGYAHPLLGHRRDARPRLREHRLCSIRSSARCSAGSASR